MTRFVVLCLVLLGALTIAFGQDTTEATSEDTTQAASQDTTQAASQDTTQAASQDTTQETTTTKPMSNEEKCRKDLGKLDEGNVEAKKVDDCKLMCITRSRGGPFSTRRTQVINDNEGGSCTVRFFSFTMVKGNCKDGRCVRSPN